jgi:hypothetical protein
VAELREAAEADAPDITEAEDTDVH